MNVMAFDIETVPDCDAGRGLYPGLQSLSDAEVAKAMISRRKSETDGNDFLPHYLHQVVTISVALRTPSKFSVWSLGDAASQESELLDRFYQGLGNYRPTLVSWNGTGFDLPVLHYRALLHGLTAKEYWEMGDQDHQYKFNNYINRFHWRHIDLMDVLSGFQLRAAAKLDRIAQLLNLPGKMGMAGDQVWPHFQAGEVNKIREYCEIDTLNTYLIYLRFERMRGVLSEGEWEDECQLVRDTIKKFSSPHWDAFLAAWK